MLLRGLATRAVVEGDVTRVGEISASTLANAVIVLHVLNAKKHVSVVLLKQAKGYLRILDVLSSHPDTIVIALEHGSATSFAECQSDEDAAVDIRSVGGVVGIHSIILILHVSTVARVVDATTVARALVVAICLSRQRRLDGHRCP